MSDFPQMPKTDVGAIEGSEYHQEIFDKLLSGWSPARIAESLKKRHNVIVRAEDISAYSQHIPAELSLKTSQLAEKFKNIDIQVDALLDMQRVLMLFRERLEVAMEHEVVTGKHLERLREGGNLSTDTLVEHCAKLFFFHLNEYVKTLHLIGDIKPPTFEEEFKAALPLLRTIMEKPVIETVEGQCQIMEPEE